MSSNVDECKPLIVGAHFFSPAHIMQLFEIIRTAATPPQVLCDTLGLSKQIKKTPVVVGRGLHSSTVSSTRALCMG